MRDAAPVSLICCDVTGLAGVGGSVLERAFAEAIATQGVVTGTAAYVRSMVQFDRARGWSPADIMRKLFPEDEIRAQAANLAFERSFQAAVDRFGVLPLAGASEALAKLAAAGVKVCLLASLSRPAVSLIVERLDWWQRADLVLCADDAPRGFPWPDLILTAILRLGVDDVRDVAVVAASEGGVLSGRRAGAPLVAGLLGDDEDAGRLRRAGATHLLADIGDLPDLVAAQAGMPPAGLTTRSDLTWPGTWHTVKHAGTARSGIARRVPARPRGWPRHRASRRVLVLGAEDVRPAAVQRHRADDH
jgi:phosphonatase-like hydrolase